MTTPEHEILEKKRLIKTVIMLSGFTLSIAAIAGFIFIDVVTEFFGWDKSISYIFLGAFCFMGITEIIAAKLLLGEADRR